MLTVYVRDCGIPQRRAGESGALAAVLVLMDAACGLWPVSERRVVCERAGIRLPLLEHSRADEAALIELANLRDARETLIVWSASSTILRHSQCSVHSSCSMR